MPERFLEKFGNYYRCGAEHWPAVAASRSGRHGPRPSRLTMDPLAADSLRTALQAHMVWTWIPCPTPHQCQRQGTYGCNSRATQATCSCCSRHALCSVPSCSHGLVLGPCDTHGPGYNIRGKFSQGLGEEYAKNKAHHLVEQRGLDPMHVKQIGHLDHSLI